MPAPRVERASTIQWRSRQPEHRLAVGKALPLLKAAVVAAPHRLDLKLQLARMLAETGQTAELVDLLNPIGDAADLNEELLYHVGRAALITGDNQLACHALHSASTRGFGPALPYYAEALSLLNRADEALDIGLRGLARSTADYKLFSVVARILLKRGETQRLWELCGSLRRRRAIGGYIPSAMALAAQSPEQQSEVRNIVDVVRRFSTEQLSLPDDFNERLSAELLGHKSLTALPATNATEGAGRRINNLDIVGGELAQRLLVNIRDAVERYAAQRRLLATDPEVCGDSVSAVLNSWAIAVWSDGHETWHIHPSGWISGVYYVAVPDVRRSAESRPGAIEFGPFPFGADCDVPSWSRWHVVPRPGMLLLFPSWYAHRTWPTGLREPRLCIAFDVVALRDTDKTEAL